MNFWITGVQLNYFLLDHRLVPVPIRIDAFQFSVRTIDTIER